MSKKKKREKSNLHAILHLQRFVVNPDLPRLCDIIIRADPADFKYLPPPARGIELTSED